MNVLHLISSGGYYGAENVMVSLAESLENQGCHSAIGLFDSPHQRNEELIRQAKQRSLPVVRIPCCGRWDRQTVRTIREILESRGVELLHTHGYKPDIYGYLAARGVGVPLVATCHLWTHNNVAVRLYEMVDSWFLRRFNAVVAVSETIARRLRSSGVQKSRIRIIDNGIDLPLFSTTHDNFAETLTNKTKLVVGTVGRLVAQKGLQYFLQAARGVLREFPATDFVVVGAGPDREQLERLAKDLAIADRVQFTGHCTDMPRAYSDMDVFVLASVDEGMPLAVLEALASRRPVVATRVGAVPSLIQDQVDGLLVAPRDIRSLVEAISKLLGDASLRRRLGAAGEAKVRQCYSRQAMAHHYLQLYREVALNFTRRAGGTSQRTQNSGGANHERDAAHVGIQPTDLTEGVRSKCEAVSTFV